MVFRVIELPSATGKWVSEIERCLSVEPDSNEFESGSRENCEETAFSRHPFGLSFKLGSVSPSDIAPFFLKTFPIML